MTSEMGYPDSVAQDHGPQDVDGTADNGDQKGEAPLKYMGPARTEYAKSGYEGRSEATTPIGPQSGFSPLGDEKDPPGSGTYTSDDELRKDWATKV